MNSQDCFQLQTIFSATLKYPYLFYANNHRRRRDARSWLINGANISGCILMASRPPNRHFVIAAVVVPWKQVQDGFKFKAYWLTVVELYVLYVDKD